jgi:hypothetical protein
VTETYVGRLCSVYTTKLVHLSVLFNIYINTMHGEQKIKLKNQVKSRIWGDY